MTNQFTTDFVKVNDGDKVDFTPQNLVQKNALINITDAQAQWRGISETTFNTVNETRTVSDTAQASINTVSETNVESRSATTTGDTEVNTESRSKTNTTSGQFGERSGSVTIGKPDFPTTTSSNSSIELESIEADYYVKEGSGGSNNGIVVSFDDDPFDFNNFDRKISIGISPREKKRVGGFSYSIDSSDDYSDFDGASIRYEDTGEQFDTTGLVIEITLNYTVKSVEQNVDRELIRTPKPRVSDGFQTDGHIVKVSVDGSLKERRQIPYDGGNVLIEKSPPEAGSTKKVVVETPGTKRVTNTRTASASYPTTPSGFSHDKYEITAFRDGDKVRDENVFSERENAPPETISSTDPGSPVEITIKGFFSKVLSNTVRTVNPSVEGEFIPEGLNTDNVVFAIDTSSSANITKQQEVARNALEQLPDSSNSGLVEFDFNATIIEELDSLSDNRSSIRDGINSLDSDGGTDMINGLSTAGDMLSGVNGSIVLVSDGRTIGDPVDEAASLGDDGIQIVSIAIDSDNDNELDLMEELADVSGGLLFEGGDIDAELLGVSLSQGELSEFTPLNGVTRTEQTFTQSIGGIGEAYFRLRFNWEFDTPQPRNGTTAFYDSSAGVWRQAAVANPDDESLEYNHVLVYNETEEEWGALDVVDTTNENAIESHQFFDEDVGWLAPRQYDTV